ncbi:uncharacterized protein N7479_002868 [Penicillium vulpinum]|uniref:Uncharacterized protein n=1 Tax=Penicillium vulpinum TaxID=29845 RepID=A0A1V6RTC2_9EURO|nr:uncharacterized protein N7479_002868 [Penicillium vulpinum]KAJ5972950.1 hypothetical protein N7479_002868 [Penicillium vulpinum]OQE04744.1 hypothetical protein PENVUL_c030G01513 [Penicillium vulpinum]
MVKYTSALALFAAVSLAAPVAQLTGRAEKHGSVEHKNLIEDIPILGPMLAGKQEAKRDSAQPEHHNLIDELPIVGKIFGNQNQRRDIGRDGISGLPIVGGLFGSHTHTGGKNGLTKRRSVGQNGGEDWKRDLASSLSSLPIIGELFGKENKNPSHKQTETPAKHLDTRGAGHAKGVFGILQSLTSGGSISKSHKRGQEFNQLEPMGDVFEGAVASRMEAESPAMPMRRDESAAAKADDGKQGNQKGKESKTSGGLLAQLMGKEGLGSIAGNSHHGVGLFPMRRDTNELEARQAAPIQGSTLTSVLLQSGALGKVTNMLSGGAAAKPDTNSPSKIGDSTTAGPPDPASGAGPHSGPGLAAEQRGAGAFSM